MLYMYTKSNTLILQQMLKRTIEYRKKMIANIVRYNELQKNKENSRGIFIILVQSNTPLLL